VLYPIMGNYNDWKIIEFEPGSECSEEDVEECMEATLFGLGETLAGRVFNNHVGAYAVEGDNNYLYYLVQWKGTPWMVTDDCIMKEGEDFYSLKKGEWVCKGQWYEKIFGSKCCYTLSGSTCIVQMREVLATDLDMSVISEQSQLSPSLPKKRKDEVFQLGAYSIKSEDDCFLLEELERREQMDFQYDNNIYKTAMMRIVMKMKIFDSY